MRLSEKQEQLCEQSRWDFSDLNALFLNCTLKRTPTQSHTEGLIQISKGIMERNAISTELLRPVDANIAYGVWPDMKEHGWPDDEWPGILEKVMAADISRDRDVDLARREDVCLHQSRRAPLCRLTPPQRCGAVCLLRSCRGCFDHGKRGWCQALCHEHLYSLQHLGFVIPPQADAGWLGEAGPGPSYLDAGSGGPENDFTNRNATFMTWNLMHMARMLKGAGGIPAHGNQRTEWDAGCRFDFDNPAYRSGVSHK